MSEEQTAAATSSKFNIGKITEASRVYIVEFFVMHVMLVGIAIAGINLFNAVITEEVVNDFGYGYNSLVAVNPITIESTLAMVALAIVTVPIFALLYVRTRKAERQTPKLVENKRRRTLLYLYLAGLFVAALLYLVALVYTVLLAIINDTSGGEELWRTILKQVFAIVWLKLLFYVAYRNTPSLGDNRA